MIGDNGLSKWVCPLIDWGLPPYIRNQMGLTPSGYITEKGPDPKYTIKKESKPILLHMHAYAYALYKAYVNGLNKHIA